MIETIGLSLLIILAAGFVSGLVCRRLGIALVVGYLLAGALIGALIGEGGLQLGTHEREILRDLAEAGALFLLFAVGLEFSLEHWNRQLARFFFVGGATQMTLVAVPTFFACLAMGSTWQSATLIASAVAFSSTVLVFKALSEWGQTTTPHGRRTLSILLFQDAALVPLLLIVPLLTGEQSSAEPRIYVLLVLWSCGFIAAVVLVRAVVARWLVPLLAALRSPELVVLFALALLGGASYVSHWIGLPAVVGAFAAGLIFSGNRLTGQVDALLLPFREAFAAMFFVSLGMLLDPSILWTEGWQLLAALAVVILLKWGAGAVAARATGLAWRPALGIGLGLAHLGEFSFFLTLVGVKAGVVDREAYHRVLCLALGSLLITPQLLRLGFRWTKDVPATPEALPTIAPTRAEKRHQAVVIGTGPVGRQVASQLEIEGYDVGLIDLSEVNLYPFAQQGFRTVAGDATSAEVLRRMSVDQAHLVIICVPDDRVAVRIVEAVRTLNSTGYLLARCRYLATRRRAEQVGANQVITEEGEATAALIRIIDDVSSPG